MKFIKENSALISLIIKMMLLIFIVSSYINLILLPKDEQYNYAEKQQGTLKSDLIFSNLIYRFPNNSEYYRERSVAYNKRGMFHRGFSFLDKAVKLEPISHLGYRGWIKLFKVRDYQGALNDFIRLDSLTKDHVDYPMSDNIHFLKGLCFLKLNNRIAAYREFETAVETSPKDFLDYKVNLYYAISKFEDGDLNTSFKLLDKVLVEYPNSCDAHYYLSKVFYQRQDFITATFHLNKAKDLFLSGNVLKDIYNELPFEIYMEDIDNLFLKIKKGDY